VRGLLFGLFANIGLIDAEEVFQVAHHLSQCCARALRAAGLGRFGARIGAIFMNGVCE
jgi:hypothetical protein